VKILIPSRLLTVVCLSLLFISDNIAGLVYLYSMVVQKKVMTGSFGEFFSYFLHNRLAK